jgi:hypothetical protein
MLRLNDFKIWVQLLATVGLALAVVWAGGLFWQDRANRESAIQQATGFSLSMHDATMAGLTGMMVTGTVAQRAVFLDQIKQLHQIRDVRVLRGDGVKQFFGPGMAPEAWRARRRGARGAAHRQGRGARGPRREGRIPARGAPRRSTRRPTWARTARCATWCRPTPCWAR